MEDAGTYWVVETKIFGETGVRQSMPITTESDANWYARGAMDNPMVREAQVVRRETLETFGRTLRRIAIGNEVEES